MKHISYYSESKDPLIDWGFRFLSTALGCRFYPVAEPSHASVIYTTMPIHGDQVHIPYWARYYERTQKFFLHPDGVTDSATVIDYIGLIVRLLTLMDEIALSDEARDQLGNLSTVVSFPRLAHADRPMVDMAVQQVKQLLIIHGLLREDEFLPRWPDGKRYAMLLTHDTDGPCLLETKELVKASIKGFVKRNAQERHAFFEGYRRRIAGASDPYFNFDHWAEFEQSLAIPSAFYIYVKAKGVPGHLHNPPYKVKKITSKWDCLRELADRDWEIGLHSSIYALRKSDYIQTEKNSLENFLEKAVVGNRCHYWSMNWRDPIESFRYMEVADLIYDCSMAWKDRPGFRSGTVLPYHPYDPQQNGGFKLLEIPTNIMDGHLFQYQKGTDPSIWFMSIVEQVRAYGGVLNLDWHTRTWVDNFSYTGWRSFLVKQLAILAASGDVWFTTPKKLSEYWLSRERQIEDGIPWRREKMWQSIVLQTIIP